MTKWKRKVAVGDGNAVCEWVDCSRVGSGCDVGYAGSRIVPMGDEVWVMRCGEDRRRG